jgi:phosphoribosylglycinamide formyltransferase-1
MRLAVLASGSGTILEAMCAAGVPVSVVVVDRRCGAQDVAASNGLACELVGLLSGWDIELVAMAGFGTILGQQMFETFPGHILNTHPALLPSFPGWHGVDDALAYGVKVTGCTVHIATEEVDAGPILAQEAVVVEPEDTVESLHERIKAVERRLYVRTISDIIERGSVQ